MQATSRFLPAALAVAAWLLALPVAPAQQTTDPLAKRGLDGLTPVAFEKLADHYVSRLGQTALAINPTGWKHSETENFVYHYFNSFIATPVSVEAEFYYRVVAKDLRKESAKWERKCHIFIFESDTDWNAFKKNASLEPWTGGIHSGGELFIQRDPQFKFKGAVLGHEVTHLVIDRFFGSNVPLWLSEGYAEYASSKAYASYHRARGYAAKPRASAIDPKHTIPLEELVHTVSYPAATEKVEVFYDQSHRLVRFLAAADPQQFPAFIEQLSKGARFDSALFRVYGARFSSLKRLESEFLPYATSEFDGS